MKTLQLEKNWEIDSAHSEIHFKVKHMMVSTVTGSFDDFYGTVKSYGDIFEDAEISFKARINSINTKNKDRDVHLMSEDFFNAALFPELYFVSTSIFLIEENIYKMIGNLTIKGITQSVELDVNSFGIALDHFGNTKAGFEITGKINRKDFGLNYSRITEAGNIVVSEMVRLELNIQLKLN